MKPFQLLLIAAGLVIFALVFVEPVKATIATEQAQISILVVVDVIPPTPSPTPLLVYAPHQGATTAGDKPVITGLSLRRMTPALQREFRAENLQLGPNIVAQAQVQNPLLVQAQVTPNPKATDIYSNTGGVTIGPVASGSSLQVPCAFTVSVGMPGAWSIQEGVTSDFASDFPGKDLANNTYLQANTPLPTSTPYIVYADDGSQWSQLSSGNALTTYCVTLTVTVPAGVPSGPYSTYAVYTLYN